MYWLDTIGAVILHKREDERVAAKRSSYVTYDAAPQRDTERLQAGVQQD